MAADEGLRERERRSPWLPVLLSIAIVVCALAFARLALPPAPHAGEPVKKRTESSVWPPTGKRVGSSVRATPDRADDRITVSVMTLGNELTHEQIAEFEAQNPDTRIAFFEHSSNLLDILLATNDLPDVFRLGQVEDHSLVERGLLLDITDRIAHSKLLSLADMRGETAADVSVDGRYYGLPQGLSTPDFTSLYVNTAALERAGIPMPRLDEPLTYAELAELASALTAKTGRPAFYSYFFERTLTAALVQRGGRMFNDDFSAMTLIDNPKALEVLRYFYDLGVTGAMYIPPATPGIAFMFENGELPISQSGYWMGTVVTPATPAYGHVTMLLPPVWDRRLPRVASYLGGTKLVISSTSNHPDQAYRFIEWYVAGKPAAERARRGWGFPLLRAMEALLPSETEFDRQRLRVALDSLKLPVARLPLYPYPDILPAFNQSWTRNMALAKSGRIKFEVFASNLQEDVNLAIQDDMTSRHARAQR